MKLQIEKNARAARLRGFNGRGALRDKKLQPNLVKAGLPGQPVHELPRLVE